MLKKLLAMLLLALSLGAAVVPMGCDDDEAEIDTGNGEVEIDTE